MRLPCLSIREVSKSWSGALLCEPVHLTVGNQASTQQRPLRCSSQRLKLGRLRVETQFSTQADSSPGSTLAPGGILHTRLLGPRLGPRLCLW